MIIEGPLGDADADVLGVDMTVRFDPCEGEVCGIVLTSLDLELTDVSSARSSSRTSRRPSSVPRAASSGARR